MKDIVSKVNDHFEENFCPIPEDIAVWFPVPKEGDVNLNSRLHPEKVNIPTAVVDNLIGFIRNLIEEKFTGYSKAKPDGALVGLSGGIDSSVIAMLCQKAFENTKYVTRGLVLGRGPEGSKGEMNDIEYQDICYATRFAKDAGIEYRYIDVSKTIEAIVDSLPNSSIWNMSGVLPRTRGLFINQEADNSNCVPIGSTNGTEYVLAAWTTGGPAGQSEPISDFYKSEVYEIARQLEVPDYIIQRRPGISELGIYDEQLYGGSCYILDPILRMLYDEKKSSREVAEKLGHSQSWVQRIYDVRIKGEENRRTSPFYSTEPRNITIPANVVWNRSYLTDIR